ncbi:MFS transporter [Pseudonocardia adelaidensis]|uniref:MFS transporter n=1 Tax=Pseudonocardia adelaidensis TaxID=648754 RepID=A0ABP9NG25_9PSEU
MSVTVDAAPRRPLVRWLVFATVVLAMLMHAIDQTSVATALSAMQADLGASLAWMGWTITIYSVGQILILPFAGPLGDRFGARRVYLVAVAAFTLMSVLCGLSSGTVELIIGRFLQGLAGGVLLPVATAIVSAEFGPDRDRAIALFSTAFPIGAVLGPLAGGLILTFASWREIFFVNVPVGILLVCLGRALIRETPRAAMGGVDLVGVGWLTALLLSGMIAITRIGSFGEGWTGPASVVVAGAVALVAGRFLLRHLHRHPDPIIPPRLLTGHSLGVMNVMNVLFGAAVIGFSALLPHYAQIRYGMSPIASGGLLTVRAVFMIVVSAVAVGLLRRLGHRPLLLAGMAAITVALVLIALPPVHSGPEVWLSLGAAVMGLGMGFASPSSANAGMHLVPEQAAAVSGLRVLFRQAGAIVAVSLVTAASSAAADPAAANTVAFLALAVVMGGAGALAMRIPNQRGRW